MAQRLIDAARFERRLMFTVDRDEICDDCLRNFLNEMAKEPTIDPVKHGRWISVNDRLPEPETEVLVVSPGWGNRLIYIGELRHMAEEKSWMTGIVTKESDWCIWWWNYLKKPNVTHWMPMPEPPTGAMNTDE